MNDISDTEEPHYQALREKLARALEDVAGDEAVFDPLRQAVRKLVDPAIEGVWQHLQNNLASDLSWHIKNHAEAAVDAILAGDKNALLRAIGGGNNYTSRDLLGNDYEPHFVKVRADIVRVHPDIIASERFADLEALIEAQRKEIRGLQTTIARLRGEQ